MALPVIKVGTYIALSVTNLYARFSVTHSFGFGSINCLSPSLLDIHNTHKLFDSVYSS
ncbi:unnamed protein product [Meloidogyne enterolobii]|uniref:Uncharacterized protein n=1 Tax=Meloidogyne enterolobii TaxID=390850 RepID=A0ACB1ACI4_MELEN